VRVLDVLVSEAGLEQGDIITHVDGKPLSGIAFRDAVSIVRGAANTTVALTVKRKGAPELLSMDARRITAPSAPIYQRIEKSIGYIRIRNLNGVNTALDETLAEMQAKRITALVLDLRGVAGEWEAFGDQFVGQRPLGSVRSRDKSENVIATQSKLSWHGHTIVLIDGTTSYFAELVASAMQHYSTSTLIGCPTQGNSRIGDVFNGPGYQLVVQSGQVISAAGVNLAKSRVIPDVEVKNCEPQRAEFDEALKEAMGRAEWSWWFRAICRRATGTSVGAFIGC
jgi:carboxyl-terminal processing protease